jgi:3-phenylpropionate/trans-cinnamate dioxygenase ferredoxin component
MERSVDVARLSDIPPGTGIGVEVAEHRVAIFHVDGELFATDSACIRCGGDLAAGTLDGHDVECPECGWRYDVVTGKTRVVPKLRLDTFEVRISATTVMVQADGALPSLPVKLTDDRTNTSPAISGTAHPPTVS